MMLNLLVAWLAQLKVPPKLPIEQLCQHWSSFAAEVLGTLKFGPDSKYVVTGFNGRLRHRSPTGPNADLRHAIYMALTDQHATLHVRKTTSRLEQKRKDFYTAPDIDLPDVAGNFAADSFADRAAEISAGDMGNANLGVSFLRARATAILKRLVEIQRWFPFALKKIQAALPGLLLCQGRLFWPGCCRQHPTHWSCQTLLLVLMTCRPL